MIHKLLQTLGALFAGNYFGGEVSRSLFRTWLFLFITIFYFSEKSPISRLPHWPKTSWRVSSGPMPLRLPIVPGFSQLVKLISSIESWNRKYETSNIPAVDKDSGAMGGYIGPYNEYYMVSFHYHIHCFLCCCCFLEDCILPTKF